VQKRWRSICASKVLLDFANLKTNSAGGRPRKKAIEKTILRRVGSCAFSHSLDRELLILAKANGGETFARPFPVRARSSRGCKAKSILIHANLPTSSRPRAIRKK
jgi:hypothetical protein